MKVTLDGYLKENIDTNITVIPLNEKGKLPIFLSELYTFYSINILGESCLLAEVLNEVLSIESLKKHMRTISKNIDGHIVFLFRTISSYRRKTLIEERIPFIIEDGQAYLPFIWMDLKKITNENIEIIEKFSSTTQLVFLYFLYNKDLSIDTTELSKILKSSVMTASRALTDLYSLGLLNYEISGKTGRSKNYKRIDDTNYYNRGSKYLRNPVNKVVYAENTEATKKMPVAGLEALAMETMLNPPKRRVRAISRKEARDIKEYIVLNRDKITDMDLIEIQIWDYEPKLLVRNNLVDLVSMVLSINENKDERVEQAIEERLKGETWYTYSQPQRANR